MSKDKADTIIKATEKCRDLQWKIRKRGVGCARSTSKREWEKKGTWEICLFCQMLKANGIDPEKI